MSACSEVSVIVRTCQVGCRAGRQAKLEASNGVLRLPLIKNKKTVNPRDSSSPPVFQLETAMGSAIECFNDSGAVVVPRERFAPVKTTNDLFALRSDAFKVHGRAALYLVSCSVALPLGRRAADLPLFAQAGRHPSSRPVI